MSKPVYIPSEYELSTMQAIAGNDYLYRYIVTKVVEKMLLSGMLLKNADESLKTIPEIVNAICVIYPQEIRYSDEVTYEVPVFLKLLERNSDRSIYNIDYLANAASVVQTNRQISEKVVDMLVEYLPNNPEYRFNYHPNELLDAIFGVDCDKLMFLPKLSFDKLVKLDPIYLLKSTDNVDSSDSEWIRRQILSGRLCTGIDIYSKTYGIPNWAGNEYCNQDILNRPDAKVKKLIKFLNKQ